MAYQAVHTPDLPLLSPPLHMPLVLRCVHSNGYFGARRADDSLFHPDCEPCTRFEPPRSETNEYSKWQIHEAIDLEGEAQDCVFAAYAGTVVEVTAGAGGIKGTITIDHHESGLGLVSRYLHVEGAATCVTVGDTVAKGQQITRLSSEPRDPHLHFELRHVIDRSAKQFWGDKNTIPIDPTRIFYYWEAQVQPVVSPAGVLAIESLGPIEVNTLPFYQIKMEDLTTYTIPLYEPMTNKERYLIDAFEKAFQSGKRVRVAYRDSVYFGDYKVPVSVRMVNGGA